MISKKNKLLLLLLRHRIRRRNRRKHRFWIRDIFLKRPQLGEMNLFREMHDNDYETGHQSLANPRCPLCLLKFNIKH